VVTKLLALCLGLAWLGVLGLAGCAMVLGIDDHQLAPDASVVNGDAAGTLDSGNDASAPDASSDALAEASSEPDALGAMASPDADACADFPSATTGKAGFEANLCNGLTCTSGDNGAVLDSGYCSADEAGLTCVVPVYAAPDAAPAPPTDAGSTSAPTIPLCSSIPGSNPIASNPGFVYPAGPAVFAIGSTAIQPYVGSIAQQYAAGVPEGSGDGGIFSATIIYVGAGSCVGVEAAYTPPGGSAPESIVTALQRNGVATVASGADQVFTATYYDPTPPAGGQFPVSYTCAIDPANLSDQGLYANVGFSDVFPSSCTGLPSSWGDTPPTDPLANAAYQDFFGPIQVMEMVVPTNSPAASITFEQAELVWGYGGAAGIAPWTDTNVLLKRSPSSGTQTMIGAAIGLDPRVWKGMTNQSSGSIVTGLESVIDGLLPDGGPGATGGIAAAMGILSSDYTGANALTLRALAFQDQGQSCAWTPDSSPSAFDKRNVRDGHYPIWGPSHLITSVTGGLPTDPVVNRLYAALNGQDPGLVAKLDVVKLYATHFIVPNCAMHVSRLSDGQGYGAYQPPARTACSCYYDAVVPLDVPDPDCTVCMSDADCASAVPARVCNVFGGGATGFCELKGAE